MGTTRAGLSPIITEEKFNIPTDKVGGFLQDKIAKAIDVHNKSLKPGETAIGSNIGVSVYTFQASKLFYPMAAIIDREALSDPKNTMDNVNAYFNPDSQANVVRLKPIVFKVIQPFMYNKDDVSYFMSQTFKSDRRISNRMAYNLKDLSKPRMISVSGNGKKIMVLIDPVKVFHNMLVDPSDPNQNFFVEVPAHEVTKISEMNYRYTVTKKPNPGGKKGNKKADRSIVDAITRNINK